MNMPSYKMRLILVASLVAAMATLGFAPYRAAGVDCPLAVQSSTSQATCCCGVSGGCRCGPACCKVPDSKPERAPLPPRPTDESNLVFGMAHAANLAVDAPTTIATSQLAGVNRLSPPADSSLLELSIRLNL